MKKKSKFILFFVFSICIISLLVLLFGEFTLIEPSSCFINSYYDEDSKYLKSCWPNGNDWCYGCVERLGLLPYYENSKTDRAMIYSGNIDNRNDTVLYEGMNDYFIQIIAEKYADHHFSYPRYMRSNDFDNVPETTCTDPYAKESCEIEEDNDSFEEIDSMENNREFEETQIGFEETKTGVLDEISIHKTDGQYTYAIYQDNVIILKSWPPQQLNIVSKISDGSESDQPKSERTNKRVPGDLYIHQNTLFILDDVYVAKPSKKSGCEWIKEETAVRIFDITNRAHPELIRTEQFYGKVAASGMAKQSLHLVLIPSLTSNMELKTFEEDNSECHDDPIADLSFGDIGQIASLMEKWKIKPWYGLLDIDGLPNPMSDGFLCDRFSNVKELASCKTLACFLINRGWCYFDKPDDVTPQRCKDLYNYYDTIYAWLKESVNLKIRIPFCHNSECKILIDRPVDDRSLVEYLIDNYSNLVTLVDIYGDDFDRISVTGILMQKKFLYKEQPDESGGNVYYNINQNASSAYISDYSINIPYTSVLDGYKGSMIHRFCFTDQYGNDTSSKYIGTSKIDGEIKNSTWMSQNDTYLRVLSAIGLDNYVLSFWSNSSVGMKGPDAVIKTPPDGESIHVIKLFDETDGTFKTYSADHLDEELDSAKTSMTW